MELTPEVLEALDLLEGQLDQIRAVQRQILACFTGDDILTEVTTPGRRLDDPTPG